MLTFTLSKRASCAALITTVALATGLAAPGGASAKVTITMITQTHVAHWTTADMKLAASVADRHWPGAPCQGSEQIAWLGTKGAAAAAAAEGISDDFAGFTYGDDTCRIVIDKPALIANSPTPDYLCATLEHEDGHLLGLTHSPDPRNVMYADLVTGPWIPEDCARAFPPRRMCKYIPSGHPVTLRTAVSDDC